MNIITIRKDYTDLSLTILVRFNSKLFMVVDIVSFVIYIHNDLYIYK